MSCHEVREVLTEFALGVLHPEQVRPVERHLEWCAGCRKELAALQEGATSVALTLAPVDPPPGLEEQVVRRIAAASGRTRLSASRGVRVLAASTLAAVLATFGALGWAIAERQNVEQVKAVAGEQIKDLSELVAFLRGIGVSPLQARLRPVAEESRSVGSATIYSGPAEDFVVVKVLLEGEEEITGLYTVWLLDRSGRPLVVGSLNRTPTGVWEFVQVAEDLSAASSIEVKSASGGMILKGRVKLAVPRSESR